MSNEEEFIKGVDKLIPRPDIALEVMTLANETECHIQSLSQKIKQDPSLMANMLKMANSAYFGHMQEINSITDIIVRLGVDTVKMLAITSASAGLLKSPQEAYNIEPGALWRHSYATALLASIIGRYGRCPALSSLYTSALLHDIGKIILNRHLQTACLNRGEEFKGGDIIQFEQTMLHTNHARVAALLLRRWQLPEDIIAPVAHHHEANPKVDNGLNCQIVYLANYLTESIGIQAMDPDNYFYRLKETDTDVPQISYFNDNIEAIITEFFEKFNESSTLEFN